MTFSQGIPATLFCGIAVLSPISAAFADAPPPVATTLDSTKPSGDPEVDQIRVLYFAAERPAGESIDTLRPAIVLLPPLGSNTGDPNMQKFARYLSEHGIGVALITLPYNGQRWPKNENKGNPYPGLYYTSGDPVRNARSFVQAGADASTVVTWLLSQPGVDANRLGVGGISLGAIVAHIAMGTDERLGVGVAMLGSGDLPGLYQTGLFSLLNRFLHPSTRSHVSWEEGKKALSVPDPLTSADKNRPRRVFMVEAARDLVIPPRAATKLWNALGRPPIRWIDANHYGLTYNQKGAQKAAWEYYRAAWGLDGATVDPTFTPELSTLTIKFGFIAQTYGANSLGITPALTWQTLSVGSRSDHLPVLHADLGITGRGPFVGVAATLTPFIDLGYASRIGRTVDAPRPYLSFHLAF